MLYYVVSQNNLQILKVLSFT